MADDQNSPKTSVAQDPRDFFSDWLPLDPAALPDPKLGPFLTTNNPEGRYSDGRPSHVWLVTLFHATTDVEGPIMGFDIGGLYQALGFEVVQARVRFAGGAVMGDGGTPQFDILVNVREATGDREGLNPLGRGHKADSEATLHAIHSK